MGAQGLLGDALLARRGGCRGAARVAGWLRATVALALAVGATAALPSAASALVVHPYLSQTPAADSPAGSLSDPCGVAVDANGMVYVGDRGNNVVDVFDSGGAYVAQIADATDLNGPCGVAVDGAGNVYVSNGNSGNAVKYSPSAFPVTGSTTYSFVGEIDSTADGQVTDVAVDPANDHVFVDEGSQVSELDASGAAVGVPFGAGSIGHSYGLAVDQSTGDVYVADDGNNRVDVFSGGSLSSSFNGSDAPATFATPSRVALDQGSGDVYVVDLGNQVIDQFSSTGTYKGRITGAQTPQGSFSFFDLAGVAFDNSAGASAGHVEIADSAGFLDIFDVGVNANLPVVSQDAPSAVTDHSAHFSGTVNSGGTGSLQDTTYQFSCDQSCPGLQAPQSVPTDGGDHAVADDTTGLVPNTTYNVTLTATNAAGQASSQQTFTTPAILPTASTQAAQEREARHVALEGAVNPNHASTSYHFDWGLTPGYGHTTADVDAGSDVLTVAAIQSLYGLTPGTTYHFRLVARNSAGTTVGADQTFTTTTPPAPSAPRQGIPGTGFLPDGRGWEQVSPTDKNGADVMIDTARTRAAAGETPSQPMAATFTSLGAFGDVQGTGIANEYMAIRTAQPGTNGWATHAITPKQRSSNILGGFNGFDPVWEREFSPELGVGVFRALSPLTDAPDVKDVENLYRRTDLRTAGAGSYQLLTDCIACTSPLPPILNGLQAPSLAGASADFRRVIFESDFPLVPGATASSGSTTPNLYEWDNGTLKLAGILPDGSVAASSIAGQSAGGTGSPGLALHTISADGSRIFFTDNSATPGSASGTLYMRVDDTTTVQINASERTTCADQSPCDGSPEPASPQPATFWDASRDGTRAFFTSGEQLTDDDHNGTVDLYMYDANAPAGHHLTRISVASEPSSPPADVDGVIGASADGRYIYFAAQGQLVRGQPVAGVIHGIYEWHEGEGLFYVGQLGNANDLPFDLLLPTGALAPLNSRVAPDGRHMVFTSASGVGLTGHDQGTCSGQSGNGCSELYVYGADSHQLSCASCDPSGATATASATDMVRTGTGASDSTLRVTHALSDDGRHVFFSTPEALVPEDSNSKSDAYEFDVSTGTVRLLSSGKDPSDSYFMDASANGSDAFFATRQQLTGWDNDRNYDLEDARAGGGFPDPPAPLPACSGDSCRGAAAGVPGASIPSSATAAGGGNVKAPPPKHKAKRRPRRVKCRHGFVRRKVRGKVRCVKAPRHKTAKKAGTQRGKQQRRPVRGGRVK